MYEATAFERFEKLQKKADYITRKLTHSEIEEVEQHFCKMLRNKQRHQEVKYFNEEQNEYLKLLFEMYNCAKEIFPFLIFRR